MQQVFKKVCKKSENEKGLCVVSTGYKEHSEINRGLRQGYTKYCSLGTKHAINKNVTTNKSDII